jgi:hypothetical protein
MGNESLYATKGYTEVIRWVDPSIDIDSYIIQRVLSVGGDTTIAGDFVTNAGETQGLVDQLVSTDTGFLGIVLGPTTPGEDYDLDDTIADGETVNILRPTGGRTIVACILASDTHTLTAEEGDWVTADIHNVAGHVHSWVYTDGDTDQDTFMLVVGKFAEVITASATDYQVVHIWY